jgi:hypothetical protein
VQHKTSAVTARKARNAPKEQPKSQRFNGQIAGTPIASCLDLAARSCSTLNSISAHKICRHCDNLDACHGAAIDTARLSNQPAADRGSIHADDDPFCNPISVVKGVVPHELSFSGSSVPVIALE